MKLYAFCKFTLMINWSVKSNYNKLIIILMVSMVLSKWITQQATEIKSTIKVGARMVCLVFDFGMMAHHSMVLH